MSRQPRVTAGLEYTAVGDTTKIASRLQAATKEAGYAVLILPRSRSC
jgi:class 3 adenylate cyclase